MIVKNINRIKVVLLFIFGLGGVVQGSSFGDDDPSHSLDGSDLTIDFHADVPNGENPENNPQGRFDRANDHRLSNTLLIRKAGSCNFAVISSFGNTFFPRRDEIFLPSGELSNRPKYIVLPPRLFERFVKDYSSFWLHRRFIERFKDRESHFLYVNHRRWMKAFNNDEKREIYRRTKRRSSYMYQEGDGIPCFILAKEGRDNDNYVVVDRQGRFFRSVPDEVNVNDLPRVSVSRAIFKKLTKDPVFVPTTFDKMQEQSEAIITYGCGISCIGALGLSYCLVATLNRIIGWCWGVTFPLYRFL